MAELGWMGLVVPEAMGGLGLSTVDLALVLDELEPVLVELARSPERISVNDRRWIRSRIDDSALLFKVRAATSDIRERVANDQ